MSTMAEAQSRRPRRRFTDEFKQQAVRLVVDEGKSVGAIARELDLVPSALGQWGSMAAPTAAPLARRSADRRPVK